MKIGTPLWITTGPGGADWLNSQHYDLSAKVDGDARLTKTEMRPMLQNLLKERVRLAGHSERRIVAGPSGTVVRRDARRFERMNGRAVGCRVWRSE